MNLNLEENIKDFVRSQGVDVVGLAGPDRLDGPPSLDPTYTMKGAKSIVSMVMPMDQGAINDYLGKKSAVPHNVDQLKENQRMFRVSEMVAGYIRSLGYKAAVVPPNNSYRRTLYVFATIPTFSHRFGAMAAGIAGQGWSGNVMTEEYGASTYLGTVVTDALLKSDPLRYSSRYLDKHPETMSEEEHKKAFVKHGERLGVKGLQNDTLLTCGNCCLVCGPSIAETAERYRLLTHSGLVVRGADGNMVNVPSFEEAVEIRQLPKRSLWSKLKDAWVLNWTFHKWYWGFEPKSFIRGIRYARRLKKAVENRTTGHKDLAVAAQNTKRGPAASDRYASGM